MKKNFLKLLALGLIATMAFSSCETRRYSRNDNRHHRDHHDDRRHDDDHHYYRHY